MGIKFGISAKFSNKVPTFYGEREGQIQYIESSIAHWLAQQGSLPLMIPLVSENSLFEMKDVDPESYAIELDALVLQGGADIHPRMYGEEVVFNQYAFDEQRDLYELKLIDAFMKHRKPILGICRGFQLLNVYFGGTLHQELESTGFRFHFDQTHDRDNHHKVYINPDGHLEKIYGSVSSGTVISIHHQGIKDLGRDLFIEAKAHEDELVEAFSYTGDNYVLGVQWHPEFHATKSSHLDATRLLEGLYKAAKNRKFFGDSLLGKRKKLKFGLSEELTLGGEIELQLLDKDTYDLKPICNQILEDIKDKATRTKGEIFQSMIEIESEVRRSALEIEKDWSEDLGQIIAAAKKHNALVAASGAHPFALISERILSPGLRYSKLMERNQWIARRIAIFGLHVHIGMRSPEEAIRFYRFYMSLSPLFLALSSSSPFWEDEHTGLASVRSTFFESIPSGGHPPCLNSWQEFEGLYHKLVSTGSIASHKDLWWDLRPSLDYGTLELRICDVLPSLSENAALVAFVHVLGLMMRVYEEPSNEIRYTNWPDLSEWSYRENKWRATRYGLDFDFILKENGQSVPAKEYLLNLLKESELLFEDLGYEKYYKILNDLIEKGNSSKKQVDVFNQTQSTLEVVKYYADLMS